MTPASIHFEDLPVARRRRPWHWLGAIGVLLVTVAVSKSILTNERYEWGVVFDYFGSERIIAGMWRTVHLTVISMSVGLVLGVILALAYQSKSRLVSAAAWAYIYFFRGTPVFVQLLFWGSISALYPTLSFGIPFGPSIGGLDANALISPYTAAVLGLGLNEAAYMAEIVRAGLKSVDRGQNEAATALGMTSTTSMRRILLPQAMRIIIPPTGNQFIGMLKTSSLVAVLAYPELLYSAQLIYSVNYLTIPLLITASLWYLILTSVLTIGQYFLERRFGRSDLAMQESNG